MKFWARAVTAAAGMVFGLSVVAGYAATPAAPSAPRSLKATAGDQKVTLTWAAPATGAPDFYQVITTPADYPRTNTSNTNLTATGLTNGKTYSFAVRAYKGSTYGPAARVTAVPKATPPSAPRNIAATPGPGAGQYTITWDPPTSTGSSPDNNPPSIDHYTVKVSPAATCAMISATSCIASNIPDNVTYTFSVTATNSRGATGPAAVVYAPLPSGASIGLQPTAGTLTTNITVLGSAFLKNESITLYWDVSSHRAATLVTDDNGAFTKVLKPFATDKPGVHKICANVQPNPCARFTLQAAPSPSPSTSPIAQETPTPSPIDSPPASGPRTNPGGNGGINGLDIMTRPPFVFLPIIGILGLLGVVAYWALSARRRPMPPAAASVVHHASRPDYMAPFPASQPPPGTPPAAAPYPPAQYPQGFERPAPPAAPPPAPPPVAPPPVAPPPAAPPPLPPAAAPPPPAQTGTHGPVEWPDPPAPDEPPDLPQPSES